MVEKAVLFRNLGRIILVLNVGIILLIGASLWYRLFLPSAYFIGAFFLGVLLAISFIDSRNKRDSKLSLLQILTLYFFILNIFFIGTKYSVLPFGDSYIEFANTRILDQNHRLSIIQSTQDSAHSYLLDQMSLDSGWPATQILTVVFSGITGVDLFRTVLVLPLILAIVSFLFVYALLKKTQNALELTSSGIVLALLLYTSWPNFIFWSFQFGHMMTGLTLFTVFIYLVLRYQSEIWARNRNAFLIIVFGFPLVFTHHLSSFVMAVYLFLLAVIITMGRYSQKINAHLSKSLSSMWLFAITIFALLILWWDSYASVIWPIFSGFLKSSLRVPFQNAQNPLASTAVYPESLTPVWALTLNSFRVILPLALTLLGFIVLLRKREVMHFPSQISFLIISGIAFFVIWVATSQSVFLEWGRMITYALPFLCVYGTFAVEHYTRRRGKLRIAISALIVLLVMSSFTGLWGISFAPLHLYSPAVSSQEVGEHSVDFSPVGLFLNKYIPFDSIANISSDDPLLLLVILPPSEYKYIATLNISDFNSSSSLQFTQIVEFNGMNLYNYFNPHWVATIQPKDISTVSTELTGVLENQADRIYDNSASAIWITP